MDAGDGKDGNGKKPRRTLEQRLAAAEAETARLKSNLKQAARKADSRKKIVLAGAMLAEARDDPAFDATIKAVAKRRVTRPEDIAAIAEWLATT